MTTNTLTTAPTPTHITVAELTEMATEAIEVETSTVGGFETLNVTFPSFDLAGSFNHQLWEMGISGGIPSSVSL